MTAPTNVTFTTGTTITSEWLNGVNDYVNELDPADHSAANVTYDPPFTNAVATTVENKLSQTVSVKDFGALPTNTTSQNKTALQAAITAVNNNGGGQIIVDYNINYGVKTRTPSTWPNFTGVTVPIVILDYSEGDTQLPDVYPTAYDGMQCRVWTYTPQTTSPGNHDGNTQWLRANWAPAYCISNDMNLAAVGDPSRTASDNRRAYYATMVDGEASWQLGNGTLAGASLTDEELSNFVIEKFAMTGDTLGGYVPYLVERKTGNISYGGGRNIPQAHHHFEAVTGSPSNYIALFEEPSTTSRVAIRNSNGSTQDVIFKNVSGSMVVQSASAGDAVNVNGTTRRVTIYKALQQSKVDITYSASMTPDADAANIQEIFCTNGTAFTINAPSGTSANGQKLTIILCNQSGGSLGTVTWNAAYKLSSWTQPATGYSRAITFVYDTSRSAWVEISRTPADVPI